MPSTCMRKPVLHIQIAEKRYVDVVHVAVRATGSEFLKPRYIIFCGSLFS